MPTTLFRDLPGVAEIEKRCLHSDKLMKDELEALQADLGRLSLHLFGITEQDTSYSYAMAARNDLATSFEEWERHFGFLYEDRAEEDVFWGLIGIDLLGEDGDYLACYSDFCRQIVCAAKELHPKAYFNFDTNLQASERRIEAEAEAWGRMLTERRDSRPPK